MKKILVTGVNGLLGQNILNMFKSKYDVFGCSLEDHSFHPDLAGDRYSKIDLVDKNQVQQLFNIVKPDVVINTAAYTNVDKCEQERDISWNINARSLDYMVETSDKLGSIFVQISTDYVFNGNKAPYREFDPPQPLGFYGNSKLAAEKIVQDSNNDYLIIRTQVLYGTGHNVRPNFATWVINELRNKRKIRIVNDQIGNPSLASDVAESVLRLLQKEEFGIFHVAGNESVSRYDFAVKIAEVFDLDKELIEEIQTVDLKQAAPRPKDSSFVLDKLYNRIDWLPSKVEEGLKKLKTDLEKN